MKKILQWLYPPRCPICDEIWNPKTEKREQTHSKDKAAPQGRKTAVITTHTAQRIHPDQYCCPSCREKLPWIREAVCMRCGKPVGDEQEYCEDCQKQKHLFLQGTAAFTYSGGLPNAVFRMKFQNRRDCLDFFADAMVLALQKHLQQWRPQMILSVPMHWKKKARRGYNQSELLAQKISERLGIAAEKNWAKCIRRTGEQKRLNRRERQKNLRNSFQITRELCGITRVLLVDDVYTTGSTMDELTRILQREGVQEVYFVVLCIGKGKKGGMHGKKSVLY